MVTYDAEILDMRDYERAGEGANGESYNHKTDPGIMVKIYNASMEPELIKTELDIARKVFDAGIP